MAKPSQLQPPVADPVQPGDRQDVAGHGRDHEDGELDGDLGHGRGGGRDQAQDLRRGDRVAVVGVVQQEPGAGRARRATTRYRRLLRNARSPMRGLQLGRRAASICPRRRAAAATGSCRLRPRPALDLGLVARRFRHPGAQVHHRGGGNRAQAEHDPPGQAVARPRAQQRQRDQRPDDQPEGLGAEDHAHQLAAVLAVGVLAHHHRADRVVTADAEAEHEPEHDQHPVRRCQRRPERPDDHDRRDQPVHPLAAADVGEPAEDQRPEERGPSMVLFSSASLARAQVPLARDQRGGDADHEQVVGVSEEPHPRHHTARRWNLLSGASSSAAIRSPDLAWVTALPPVGRIPPNTG